MSKENKTPETRLTRGMHERLLYMDQLLRRKKPLTAPSIGKHFHVSDKTVRKDLAYLRDRMGMPLDFDEERNTWYYTEEVVNPLPDQAVTEGEFFVMMVARAALEQYRGLPFHRGLTRSAEKMARALRTKVSFSVADFACGISFRSMGTPKIDPAVFNIVSRGMTRQVAVTFDYQKPGDRAARRRTAQFWHLSFRNAMWYVVAYDEEKKARRTFALTRIQNPVLTLTRFTVPEDFSPDTHFAKAFSVLGGNGDYRIVIRFRGASAVRVQECEWHETEKWRPLPNGEVELELRLGALEEIERWILSWGPEAEAIEPQPLRDRIAATVAQLARAYGVDDRGARGEAAAG
jgi:proteasome accessory factor B